MPSFYLLLTVFILVMVGTKNGRSLVSQQGPALMRQVLLKVPFTLRRRIFRMVLGLPLPVSKKLLDNASKPQGKEKAWIRQLNISSLTLAHWIGSPSLDVDTQELDLVVLYFHGGGFCVGNSTMYMASFMTMLNRWEAQGLKARILSVDYPLAITHAYPHAPDACFEAYEYLVHTLSMSPTKIVIAGDSAGGNLVANLLLRLVQERTRRQQESLPPLPQPLGGVMISPWVDLQCSSPSYATNAHYDMVTRSQLDHHVSNYLPLERSAQVLCDPLVSPVYGSYTAVTCPLMVAYSANEVFQHDIERFIEKARKDGVKVDVICQTGQPHIWVVEPTFATDLKVWEDDLIKVADWISGRVLN